jgi:hypothetical protein
VVQNGTGVGAKYSADSTGLTGHPRPHGNPSRLEIGYAHPAYIEGVFEPSYPTETGSTCTAYGGPLCIYPWFTRNADGSFSYGVGYPTTVKDYGKANQFAQTLRCGGPFGPHSTYCQP